MDNKYGLPFAPEMMQLLDEQLATDKWRLEVIPASLTGLSRDIQAIRGPRQPKTILTFDWHGDKDTFCPPLWWDAATGAGACHFACRFCIDATTWIYTDIGPVQAQELYRRAAERNWIVLGFNNEYQAVWTPLLAISMKPVLDDMVGFKLDTGHQIQVTKDHPMIVARPHGFEGWRGELPAEQVINDDWLPIVKSAPVCANKIIEALDLLHLDWGTPMMVEDFEFTEKLSTPIGELAKAIGQELSPRSYPLTQQAYRGAYALDEYKQVLNLANLSLVGDIRIRAAYAHRSFSLPRFLALDWNFGFLLGHYLAEGSKNNREISLSIHKNEVEYIKEKWEAYFGVSVDVSPHAKNGAFIRIANSTIAKLFNALVPGNAFTKRVPLITWQAPLLFKQGLLAGLLYGDGHQDKWGSVIYATTSEGLAADIRMLAWQLGYSPTVIRNNYRGQKIAFQIRLQQQQAVDLITQLGLPWQARWLPRRSMITHRYPYALLMNRTSNQSRVRGQTGSTRWKQRLEPSEINPSLWGRQVMDGDLGLAKVRQINHTQATCGVVYDLQTGTGNFVAGDGILVHNCFLLLTHRQANSPHFHRVYDNVEDFYTVIARWLKATEWPHPRQKGKMVKLARQTTLGLGIDRSDSLLYEGVTGHARRLIPLFAGTDNRVIPLAQSNNRVLPYSIPCETNPQGRRLILLTKSANTHYLDWRNPDPEFTDFGKVCARYAEEGQTIPNVSVTFSMNPESIADLWEGKWSDTLTRITPSIDKRLEAARFAASLGWDIRWRVDPVLPIDGWQDIYYAWLVEAVERFDAQPSYITLGSYREKNAQLDLWRDKWGLPAPEYDPGDLVEDGTHRHLPEAARAEIYGTLRDMIREVWGKRGRPVPAVSLCKESHTIRKTLDLCNAECNCLQ